MALYFNEGISQKPRNRVEQKKKNISDEEKNRGEKPAMNSGIRLEVVINSI